MHIWTTPRGFQGRKSGEIIGDQIKDAEKRMAEMQRLAELPKIEADFNPEEFFPYLFDEPYIHYYDSLTFEPDSLLQIYRLVPLENKDTLFDGIRIVVRADSLAVKDSLLSEPADSLRIIPEPEKVLLKEQFKRAGSKLKKTDAPAMDKKWE